MNDFEIIVDENVKLRLIQVEESGDLYELISRNISKFKSRFPAYKGGFDEDDCNSLVNKNLNEYDEGKSLNLGIYYNDNIIGCIGLSEFKNKEYHAGNLYWSNINYFIDTNYENINIIFNSANKLIDYGFYVLGIDRIQFICSETDKLCVEVANKLSFVLEVKSHDISNVNESPANIFVFGLLRSEYVNKG